MLTAPEQVAAWLASFKRIREISYPLALREYEPWQQESEVRYFYCRGHWLSPEQDMAPPAWLTEIEARVDSPFYSVDVIQHQDGTWRLVEIGDGQVSDLVGAWQGERFAALMLAALAGEAPA